MIFLPTLNRIGLLHQFFRAYRETESTEPGWVVTDKKDYEKNKEGYLSLELPHNWSIKITDAVTMGDKSRELWEDIIEQEHIIILNDDHQPRTKRWDQTVVTALNGVNIIATNDGPTPDKPWNAPARLCGAIAFSQKVLKTLGYLFPPGLHHLFSDDVWGVICSKAQNAQVLMDVCVEHVHAYKSPALIDDTFKAINGENALEELKTTGQCQGGLWPADKAAFERWFREDAANDSQKVLDIQPKMGVFLATPSHDGDCSMDYAAGLADSLLNMSQRGVYFELGKVIGSSLIPHARNSLADLFLKSRCQKMLFVDADQSYNANDVITLFSSPRRIIAGIVPHKRWPINLNFDPLEEDKKYFKDLNNKSQEEFKIFAKEKANKRGEVEVNRIGTGFVMIDRSVFEIMREHVEKYHPFDLNDKVSHSEYFKMGADKESKRYQGEDWFFCKLAKELKIPLYINVGVTVAHKGTFTWNVERVQV